MATLSTKGQIVIPKQLREEMRLKPGTDISVERLDDSILLIPEPEDPVEALCGMFKGMFDEDAVTMVRSMRDEDQEKVRNKPWY